MLEGQTGLAFASRKTHQDADGKESREATGHVGHSSAALSLICKCPLGIGAIWR